MSGENYINLGDGKYIPYIGGDFVQGSVVNGRVVSNNVWSNDSYNSGSNVWGDDSNTVDVPATEVKDEGSGSSFGDWLGGPWK